MAADLSRRQCAPGRIVARAKRRSAQVVDAIVAKGEPVYGINTGFGKLASVRIEREDLETLQRTSCCRMPLV